MSRRTLEAAAIVVFCSGPVIPDEARAADTTETYAVGPSEIELYGGIDGLGMGTFDRSVWAETLIGWGFVDRFSGYLVAGWSADGALGRRARVAGFGIFGTPVDTDHVDLDLVLDLCITGEGIEVTPSLELNLDLAPDLALAGLYLAVGETLGVEGHLASADPILPGVEGPGSRASLVPSMGLLSGIYWTVSDGHQLLIELDAGVRHGGREGERILEIGGLALGYNAVLTEILEILVQVSVDVPQRGEKAAAGLMLGLILALPGAAGET